MSKKLFSTCLAACAVTLTSLPMAQSALAAPAQIVGTYSGGASGTNVMKDIRIKVVEQRPQDNSQKSECRMILGDMTVGTRTGRLDGSLLGYYCPKTGAFAFTLNRQGDGATMQLYQGKMSDDGKSMDGNFHYISGDWGKYNFSTTKID